MIKFQSFLEGLRYHPKCPLCKNQTEVNDRDLVERVEYPLGHPYQKFKFYLGSSTDDIMVISSSTEEVEIKESPKLDFSFSRSKGNYNLYSGMSYVRLTINCNSCCQYHFTLQIQADLSAGRLVGTYLNSEAISVEEGSIVHMVKNIYSTEKTEYSSFPKDGSSKKQSMPLIPLNLSNPKETISRIKKLLIFS